MALESTIQKSTQTRKGRAPLEGDMTILESTIQKSAQGGEGRAPLQGRMATLETIQKSAQGGEGRALPGGMMLFEDIVRNLSADALSMVSDGQVIGLGSGRTAAAFTKKLAEHAESKGIRITGVPTSLQIRQVAEECGIPLIDPGSTGTIDIVFDGADQVDRQGNLIKGGGGALLTEGVLIGMAKKVVIMADESKFADTLNAPVPVEVYPAARTSAAESIMRLGGRPVLRLDDRGFPRYTENRNLVLDCIFGEIANPGELQEEIVRIPGVAAAGIITRRPDVTYRAKKDGRYDRV